MLADIKKQQAEIQSLQLQLVKARTQLGLKKNSEAKGPPAAQQTKTHSAKRHRSCLECREVKYRRVVSMLFAIAFYDFGEEASPMCLFDPIFGVATMY